MVEDLRPSGALEIRKATYEFDRMMKRINLTGSTLRPRTVEFKSKVACELRETVWPLLDRQKIGVYIDSIFPLEKFKDAHIRMESGNHLGKIILSLD